MSRVYLLRHAKARWASPGMRDIDRPLAPEGGAAASALGDAMRTAGYIPEIVVVSPARRTRQTLECLRSTLATPFRAVEDERLFSGGADTYLDAVRTAGDARSIMLIGHNRMIEEVALALPGKGEPIGLHRLRDGFPTSGLAVIDFEGTLSEITPGAGTLVDFRRPSDL